jgi:ComF family protein
MLWRSSLNALLSAVIAPPCAACGRVLDRPLDGAVCDVCWDSVISHVAPFSLQAIARGRSIGAYEGALRDILHALKYGRRRSLAQRLSRMMAEHGRDVLADAQIVVPVPLHRRRERERGFNQADDLARGLGLPIVQALRRTRMTRPQVDLPKEERRENVQDAFAMATNGAFFILRHSGRAEARPLQGAVEGAVVVLVDDVATTGATLDACARVLKDAGAVEVRALTAARVVSAPR